jgi:hypothetical protein
MLLVILKSLGVLIAWATNINEDGKEKVRPIEVVQERMKRRQNSECELRH